MSKQNKKEKKEFSNYDTKSQNPIKGKEFNIKDSKKISGGTGGSSMCSRCSNCPCTCC